jgi:predicted DNA-binding transcriptional regulator AlpA
LENENPLLSVQEAEVFFKCSRSTLWRREKSGEIPPKRKIGGSNYWLRSEAEAWQAAVEAQVVPYTPPVAVSKPPTAVSAAVNIFDNTPFLKACGLHMPNTIAVALGAAIDKKGNLTYRNAAGGLIVCGDTTTADPQKIQVTGAISFSKIGNPLLTSWTIVETLHDLLIICRAGGVIGEVGEGYIVLNHPTAAKRIANFLAGRATKICLMLSKTPTGEKVTKILLSLLPGANDMRAIFPE